jgi:hypothetical protein
LLNIPTIDLKARIRRNKVKEQDDLMKSMAPRRLLTPYVLQRFPLLNVKLEQILATSLREEQRARAKSGRGEILA